jgi:dTDP-4-dehydrorhamnose reductase
MSSLFKTLDKSQPILVFGCDGQIGRALQVFFKDFNLPAFFLGRADCDLSNEAAIIDVLNRYKPQVIINAAAYTAVDKAESMRELAFAINAKAPAVMAQYVSGLDHGIFLHYSTDYVFSDSKQSAYSELDEVGPIEKLGIYGQSKLAGEQEIQEIFNQPLNPENVCSNKFYQDNASRYYILRTSWVYGEGDNFIRTMLYLASEQDQIKVVADQVGVPSSAEWLARVAVQLADSKVKSGIYHAVPDGETSWYGLARFAIEAAISYCEGIEFELKNILPIPALAYPFQAPRPYNSRLNNSKLKNVLSEIAYSEQYPQWQKQVDAYVKNHIKASQKN